MIKNNTFKKSVETYTTNYDVLFLLYNVQCIAVVDGVAQSVRTSVFGWRTFPDLWLTCDRPLRG